MNILTRSKKALAKVHMEQESGPKSSPCFAVSLDDALIDRLTGAVYAYVKYVHHTQNTYIIHKTRTSYTKHVHHTQNVTQNTYIIHKIRTWLCNDDDAYDSVWQRMTAYTMKYICMLWYASAIAWHVRIQHHTSIQACVLGDGRGGRLRCHHHAIIVLGMLGEGGLAFRCV
jgi:hypothetical protein